MEQQPSTGVAGWLQVSRPSLAELYEAYSPGAVRLAYVLTGDIEAARDLSQDAFVKLFGRYRDMRNPAHFAAYLRKTIVNLSKNHRRKQARARTHQTRADTVARVDADAPDEELRDALMRLPHRQRAAVALRYLEDLSEQQAADVLDVTVPALKSLTQRGMATLREQMKGDE